MTKQYTKEEIYNKLWEMLINDFEISKDLISPNANLFEDLDLDSIDAVDLAVKLQFFTNKKLSPDKFKQIHTVEDVVNAVEDLLQCD